MAVVNYLLLLAVFHIRCVRVLVAPFSVLHAGDAPYMVYVTYPGLRECSGFILSEEWVMTSAYCVLDDHDVMLRPENLSVAAGDVPHTRAIHAEVVQVKLCKACQDCRNDPSRPALLKVNPRLELGPLVNVMAIAKPPFPPNFLCDVVGFKTRKRNPKKVILVKRFTRMANRAMCRLLYGINVTNDEVCSCSLHERLPCEGRAGSAVVCARVVVGLVTLLRHRQGQRVVFDCRHVLEVDVYKFTGAYLQCIRSFVDDLMPPVEVKSIHSFDAYPLTNGQAAPSLLPRSYVCVVGLVVYLLRCSV